MRELVVASLMADNAAFFSRDLAAYLSRRLHLSVTVLENVPWQERERQLYRGDAHLGVVCGLQYVYAVNRRDTPGVELVCAPVMRAERYERRPVYFSDVVVRSGTTGTSLSDLRGARFAFNEPTSHSGYNLPRSMLAARGHTSKFFGEVVESGAHERSLQLILDGTIDAAALDTTVLEQELRLQPDLSARIRVVETLGPSPIPPLVVSRAVAPELRQQIRQVLLAIDQDGHGQRLLERAHMTRFVAVKDADYDPIRQMAALAGLHASW
ncbi:MAG TPA: PhnD/SsuA/transferrin family substrate-binding protein [Chloroflexota bacterium]|jgi:phosphonate transport system substrate-binding protein|nr:PhnD/SsuA/transferrin family substrate-binding protein [Chloroflexota bacterium]